MSASLHRSLFPNLSLLWNSFSCCHLFSFWHIWLCSPSHPFFSSIFLFLSPPYMFYQKWQGWAALTPSVRAPTQESFFTPALHSKALVSFCYCTGTRIAQPKENNKWTYMDSRRVPLSTQAGKQNRWQGRERKPKTQWEQGRKRERSRLKKTGEKRVWVCWVGN